MGLQKPYGIFWGVGVGFGTTDLLTKKAIDVLNAVDAIFYPFGLKSSKSRALQIIDGLKIDPKKHRMIQLRMTQDRAKMEPAYDQAVDEIAQMILAGSSAAYITEGDPLFYSTFTVVYEKMKGRYPQVPIKIIPGISCLHAAASAIGLPIAHLSESVAILPGPTVQNRLRPLSDSFHTILIMKVDTVIDSLIEEIRTLPAGWHGVYIENVASPSQVIVYDLESLKGKTVSYFSVVLLYRGSLDN